MHYASKMEQRRKLGISFSDPVLMGKPLKKPKFPSPLSVQSTYRLLKISFPVQHLQHKISAGSVRVLPKENEFEAKFSIVNDDCEFEISVKRVVLLFKEVISNPPKTPIKLPDRVSVMELYQLSDAEDHGRVVNAVESKADLPHADARHIYFVNKTALAHLGWLVVLPTGLSDVRVNKFRLDSLPNGWSFTKTAVTEA